MKADESGAETLISFIVPTLNEAKTIGQTLASVGQFRGDHEIIISDGGSHDGTLDICRKHADRVIVYSGQERQTIALARNMGAAEARGEHLVFIDADVVIPQINDFFDVAIEAFRSRPRLVAMTVKYRVFPELASLADRYVFSMLGLQFFLQNNVFRIGAAGGEFQMITKDAFDGVGGFDERLAAAEDMDLFRRLSKIGQTRFVRNLVVFHTGRRAHAVGWPRLLWSWFTNSASVFLFRRSVSKVWKEIR